MSLFQLGENSRVHGKVATSTVLSHDHATWDLCSPMNSNGRWSW